MMAKAAKAAAGPSTQAAFDPVLRTLTRRGGEHPSEEQVLVPTLTFLSGDALGRELPLLRQRVLLGRGEDADVFVLDPAVSRRHLQLLTEPVRSRRGLKVTLEDLGSTNGTLVNSRRVKRVVLKPGDKIRLGGIVLKFEYRDVADQQFYDEMYRLATTDALTGLLNKYAIMQFLAEEVSKADRYGRKLSIVLLDLDDFKSLNDTHGHLAGDKALQLVARLLSAGTRRHDRCGRFGGEEFLLVLPETATRGARALADRLRQELAAGAPAELHIEKPVTASFGVAGFRRETKTVQRLLEWADRALYRAKARGKNRVELWAPSMDTVGSP